MSSTIQLSLLRRTFAALAAAAFVFTASDALAQGNRIKLTGGNKNDECEFSSMSITPAGGVSVQCSGTTAPPPPPPPPVDPTVPGVFSMSNAAMSAAANSTASVSVMRTGGSLAATIYYWYTGNGCKWYDVGALNFAQGALVAFINAPVTATGTACTVNLAPPAAPASLGAQTTTTINVTASVEPPPPPANPNCPAGYSPPQSLLGASFAGLGNPLLQMQAAGQVVQIPLPSMNSSGQVTFGESAGGAYTPQPVTLEVSINKCPGLIETDYTNRCNIRSTNGNYNSITWLAKAYQSRGGGGIDASTASANGLCWAGGTDQYYINARWSYSSCAFGAQVCGFAIQYNLGGY